MDATLATPVTPVTAVVVLLVVDPALLHLVHATTRLAASVTTAERETMTVTIDAGLEARMYVTET